MTADNRMSAVGPDGEGAQNPSQAWQELAADYERARAREDSLERLVEWAAERDLSAMSPPSSTGSRAPTALYPVTCFPWVHA